MRNGAVLAGVLVALALPQAAEARECGTSSNGLGVLAWRAPCPFAKKVANKYLAVPPVELKDGVYGPPPKTIGVYLPSKQRRVKMRCRTVVTPNSPYMLCKGGRRRVEIRS